MRQDGRLQGQCILVVEDEYYIATDAARVLRDAGADVIGPCPNEDAARARLSAQRPHAVVLDINLGAGASFSLAQHLRSNDIPFVLVTGYDASVIPAAYASVERLEKPVQPPRLVDAIERLLHLRV